MKDWKNGKQLSLLGRFLTSRLSDHIFKPVEIKNAIFNNIKLKSFSNYLPNEFQWWNIEKKVQNE